MIDEIIQELNTRILSEDPDGFILEQVRITLEKFLPKVDVEYYNVINVREFAWDMADKQFKEEYEDSSIYRESELYDITMEEGHGKHKILNLKDYYQDIFNEMVDTWEETILKYEYENTSNK